jgi:hypothetical protein
VAALVFAGWTISTAHGAAEFTPTSDTAVIETFTRLASHGDLLLGPYSRFQWHHPGPLAFYAMAPVYNLAGATTTSLNAAALLINVALFCAAIGIALRCASPVLATMIAVSLSWLVWRTPDLLTSPWNAHLPVLAGGAMLIAAAAALSRTPWALAATALCASFAAQTHVALLPLSLACGIGATVGFVVATLVSAQRRGVPLDARSMAFAMALSDVTALVLWAPSLVDQFTSGAGNLGLIWTYFVEQPHQTPSFMAAVSAWADMLAGPLRPDFYLAQGWRFVESPVRWAEAAAGLEWLGVAAAGWFAWRDSRHFDAALSAVLAMASSIALWSATRIDGEIYDHAVFWMAVIGALNLAVCASLLFRLTFARVSGDQLRAAAGTVGALAIGLAVLMGARSLTALVSRAAQPTPESRAAAAVASALTHVIADRHLERPVIRFDQDAWGMASGVVLELQRAGIPVAVEDDWLAMYTPAFKASSRETGEIAIVGAAEHVRRSTDSRQQLIAESPPLLFAYLVAR